MNITKTFSDIRKSDADIAGGKGASLGEMTQEGIPVPPGFVVLAEAFETFLRETNLNVEIEFILQNLNHNEMRAVKRASETIRALIIAAKIPVAIEDEIRNSFSALNATYVAVRSSATAEDSTSAAWAGQLNSFLNTTERTLIENVRQCWASLFTTRAIFYRFENRLDTTKISVAVVVQKMIESEVSGIAFSVHPVTQDHNQLIIEAGWGLGEAIVSGLITPDAYVVEKNPRRIIYINASIQERALYRALNGGNEWKLLTEPQRSSQCLDENKILELSELIIRIENHYGFPCDIEWAFSEGEFFITQSRPITTIDNSKSIDEVNIPPKLNVVDINDYQKFTQVDDVATYFFAFGFLMHIADLGGLVEYNNQIFKSYISKHVITKTKTDGESIFLDTDKYTALKNEVPDTFLKMETAFNKLSVDFTKTNLLTFLDIVDSFSLLYRNTEFFYTDSVYGHKINDQAFLADFEKFKLESRKLVNQQVYNQDSFMKQVLRLAADKFKIVEEELAWYKMPEIISLFEETTRVSEDLIKKRKNGYVMFFDVNGKLHEHVGEDAKNLILRSDNMNILKGTTAYPGLVTGKARVVHFSISNFESMSTIIEDIQEGEILVADSTIPEIIQACKKASAIITNQGGMMSHAAITAREFRIPCIVGVENATAIIRNGDSLLVDANQGVIKIIT